MRNAIVFKKVYETGKGLVGAYQFGKVRKLKAIPSNITDKATAEAWMQNTFLPSLGPAPVALTINGYWDAWSNANETSTNETVHKIRAHYTKWIQPYPIADLDLENDFCAADLGDWVTQIQAVDIRNENDRQENKPPKLLMPNSVLSIVNSIQVLIGDIKTLEKKRRRKNEPKFEFAKWPGDVVFSDKEDFRSKINTAPKDGRVCKAGKKITLEPTQVWTLLNSWRLTAERRTLLYVGFGTGLRGGEVAGLRWMDLDAEGTNGKEDRFGNKVGIPTLTVAMQVKQGSKGTGDYLTNKLKTPGSYRTIPIPPIVVDALLYWDTEWKHHVGREPKPNDLIFPDQKGNPRAADAYADILKTELEACGVGKFYTLKNRVDSHGQPVKLEHDFHSCRRTYSTWLANHCNLTTADIEALTGHAPDGEGNQSYIDSCLERFYSAVASLPLAPDPKKSKALQVKIDVKRLTA
jgi:integrase